MTAADIAARLDGRPSGSGWSARCPAHDDRTPSMSLTDRDGRVLVKCHAGCEQASVIEALRRLGLWPCTERDRKSGARPGSPPNRPPDHVWLYFDANGAVVRRTARWNLADGKVVRPQIPDGPGKWRTRDMEGPRPLYLLPDLLAQPHAPVVVVEGERTADAGAAMLPGYVVTTSAGGAKAAKKTDWGPVRGRRLVVFPDADVPGAQYAVDVTRLAGAAGAVDVRVVALPAGCRRDGT